MKQSPLEQRLDVIIRPVVEDMGLDLVWVKMTGDGKRNILQVLAENPETRNLGVDDAAKLSRSLSAALDVEDPIVEAYTLEVGSPGIDRPLTRLQDFETWKDCDAKIELDMPIEGQKRFRGFLKGLSEEQEVLLETDQGMVAFPANSVHKAKLVLSDALIEKTRPADPQKDKEAINGTGTGR